MGTFLYSYYKGKRYKKRGGGEMDEKQISEIYERNADRVYRLCFSYLKNPDDAFDAMQNTFYQMLRKDVVFENPEHEKAWLIVTASNVCKNVLSHWWRKRVSIEERDSLKEEGRKDGGRQEDKELLMVVLKLPVKYRISIYLHYYEGYTSVEIGKMLGKSDATIRGWLKKGRELLGKEIG